MRRGRLRFRRWTTTALLFLLLSAAWLGPILPARAEPPPEPGASAQDAPEDVPASEASPRAEGPEGWERRLEDRKRKGSDTIDNLPHVPPRLQEEYREFFDGGLYLKFGGFVQADLIQDLGDPGNQFSFVPSQIPLDTTPVVQNTGFVSLGDRARLSFRRTRAGVDLYTPFPKFLEGTRFYVEADLSGEGGSPNLRHAFVSYPFLLVGRTDSVFKDADSEPETVDSAGPNAMIGTRQDGIRLVAPMKDWSLALSLEDSGGIITPTGVVLSDDRLRQRADYALHLRGNQDWGHLQLSGILRNLQSQDYPTQNQTFPGWGAAVTGRAFLGELDNLQFVLAGGNGIGRLIQDLQGTRSELGLDSQGRLGTQRAWGTYLAYQHFWSEKARSTVYAGIVRVDLRDGQPGNSYKTGAKAAVNYFETLSDDLTWGVEAMWGRRENLDGQSGDAGRVQGMIRYKF